VPKRNKKPLVYLLLILLPLSFLFLKQTFFNDFRMRAVGLMAFPIKIVLFPFQEIKKVMTYQHIYNEYKKFKEEAESLRARYIEEEELIKENKRLKSLLDLKQSMKYPSVAAKVIGRDPSQWSSIIIIDKGEKDGLKTGMPVVSASSVLGRILETGKDTSKVMLLNDPAFSVAALIERSRESGLISGTLHGKCRMRYLAPEADIRVGDKVLTSDISSSFPGGFLIGEVLRIEENLEGPTMECVVLPAASLSQVEEVLIIKNIK